MDVKPVRKNVFLGIQIQMMLFECSQKQHFPMISSNVGKR